MQRNSAQISDAFSFCSPHASDVRSISSDQSLRTRIVRRQWQLSDLPTSIRHTIHQTGGDAPIKMLMPMLWVTYARLGCVLAICCSAMAHQRSARGCSFHVPMRSIAIPTFMHSCTHTHNARAASEKFGALFVGEHSDSIRHSEAW